MTATTAITIYVNEDNPFNTGWLCYLLGLPRPDPETDPLGADGWDMGRETPTLLPVRAVFDPGNTNYAVSLRIPKPQGVRIDQKGDIEAIEKEQVKDVARAAVAKLADIPESELRALEGDR